MPDERLGIPLQTPKPLEWLDQNWMFAGTLVACFLIALWPMLRGAFPPYWLAVYTLLLAYQVHQIEEHLDDRFRRFVNAHVAGGVDALTPRAVMWINVGLVWMLYLASLLLAAYVNPGFALIPVYVTLVNTLLHLAPTLALRRYNPGLVTAVVLFCPLGVWSWRVVSAVAGSGWHVLGLLVALLVHAGIVVVVIRRRTALRTAAPAA